jgi:anti-sigma factor RsiW
MKCAEINAMLPAYADKADLPLAVRRHLAGCTDCREELAAYGELSGALSTLRSASIEPPPALRASLLAIPSEARRLDGLRSHVSRNKKTYAGVLVAAAGAAGAAVWRSRRAATA